GERRDDAREGRRVARRDGAHVDLRSRAGFAGARAKRLPVLAGAGGVIELTLDGRTIHASDGELLLHAAARHGVFIPTLCHDDRLEPYGGCRMCVVEVEGAPRPLPACATRAREGMVVSTNGSTAELRRTLTEMLLAEHLR